MSECSSNYIAAELEEAEEIEKQLDRYEKLDVEAEELEEDKIYRKKIVR